MNVKKQLLIFVALMVLLVGVASATDVSDDVIGPASMTEETMQETQTATDMNNMAIQDNEEKYVERDAIPENDVTATQSIQKNNNRDNTKEATSVTTWEQLKQTITQATEDTTITLQENIINTETIGFTNGIAITIDGNGKTINGNQKQVFLIGTVSTLILKNITITNAKSDIGGAIDNRGTLNIIDSTLTNNQAYRGGAIFNWETLTISNSTLANNTANNDGGAIYIYFGNLTIKDSTLANNTATYDGGAIDNICGNITIFNSTLKHNEAVSNGGAIFNYKSSVDAKFNVTETIFIQNHAGRAGAICSDDGNTNIIINNTFTGNTADDNETLYILGEKTIERNIYDSTDISFKTINLTVNDNQETFETGEDVTLNFIIELEHREYYDMDILEKITKTLYINGEENVTTTSDIYTLSNLKPGTYSVYYTICNQQSNTLTLKIVEASEISTHKTAYDYYGGVKNDIILDITDTRSEKGTADIRVKDGDEYQELVSCHNVRDGYTFSTEILNEALKNLYNNDLDNSYVINVTYISNDYYVTPSSTEFTLNIIKQRNTTIIYDILNNTEGNVQINITVLDDIYRTPLPDAAIKITGDISQETTSGVITDKTLRLGDYTITVNYQENEDYKASIVTIDFTVEIDKDEKIEELEEEVEFQHNIVQDQTIIIDILNNKINELNNTVNEQTIIINDLNNIVQDQNIIINDLNNTVEEQTTTIDELNNTVQEQNSTINTLNNTINELNNTVQEQSDIINTLNNTVNEQNDKINEITEQNEELNSTINSQSERIDDLEEQIRELTGAKDTTIILNPITDAKYNSNVTISGMLINEDSVGLFNQVVTLSIGDETVNVTTRGGIFEYNTTLKTVGEQTIPAIYAGTDKYKASNTTQTFTVNKRESKVTINDIACVTCNENITITGLITDIDGNPLGHVNVFVYLNGEEQHITTYSTGIFKATYTTSTVGEQVVLVKYKGNTKYLASNATATFTTSGMKLVMFTIKPVTYRDNYTIQGKLTDYEGNIITGAEVQLNINGETVILTTDKNGKYTYKAQALELGNFTVTATYNDETTETQLTATKTLTVTKHATKLIIDEIPDTTVATPTTITGKLTDDSGTIYKNCNIFVKVNGVEQQIKTDTKGMFTCTYSPTSAGTQNVTVTYKGNSNYLGDKATKSFEASD